MVGFAHRARPFELEAVGVMDEAIEDGIGEGGIADEIVPGFDRELAGNQRRRAAMSILDDLHEIVALTGVETVGTEVVEDQQIDLGQRTKETVEAAVAVGELELCEEPRRACVVCPVALATGSL